MLIENARDPEAAVPRRQRKGARQSLGRGSAVVFADLAGEGLLGASEPTQMGVEDAADEVKLQPVGERWRSLREFDLSGVCC